MIILFKTGGPANRTCRQHKHYLRMQESQEKTGEYAMRKLLIVIDMQNDFIDGALGTAEALAIVENVKNKIRSYPPEDIFATLDTHHDALLAQAARYEKPTFGSTALAADIRSLSEQEDIELELVGLCTDICVVSNALLLKAAMPEVKISVDASCCAGVTPEKHLAALETMRSCQIQVINS